MEQAHERLAISSPTVLAQHCIQSPQNQFSQKKHPQDVEVTLLAARVETGVEVSLPSSAGSHQTTLWIIGGGDSRSLRASRKYCSPGSPHTLPLPLHRALGQAHCPSFPSQDSPYSSGHRYIHTRKVFSSTPAVQDFPCTLNPV